MTIDISITLWRATVSFVAGTFLLPPLWRTWNDRPSVGAEFEFGPITASVIWCK